MSAARTASSLRSAGRMAAWRAHAYGGRAELRLESAREPPLRAPDELLVRVRATSLNPLDVAMLDGYGARILNVLRRLEDGSGGSGVEFPLVAGRDFVGEVRRAGPHSRVRAGARVWGVVPPHRAGAHADYVLVKDAWVGPAPSSLDDLQAGGALYAALSACAVLRAAGLRAAGGARGKRVLLLGLGGAGHAALQLLVADGAHVVVGCAGDVCERALALGAARALDRHAPRYGGHLVDHGPYDAIVDCAGLGGDEASSRPWQFKRYATLTTPLLRATDERGLAAGAAAALARWARQWRSAAAPAPAAAAAAAAACDPPVRWAYFSPSAGDIRHLYTLAERGQFQVQVERAYPWWEAAAAYARAARGSARGKLLLDFTADPPPGLTVSAPGREAATPTPPPPPPGRGTATPERAGV